MLSRNTALIFVLMAKTGKTFGEIREGLRLIDAALDLLDRAPDRRSNELIQSLALEKEKEK